MANKKPQSSKPKLKPSLSQKERFMEYARKVKADESGERFEKALEKILPDKVPKNRWITHRKAED